MKETTSEPSFLDKKGYNYSIFQFIDSDEDDPEDIILISSDDRIVKAIDGVRMRLGSGYGCGGTTSSQIWTISEIRKLPKNSYNLAKALPIAIEAEKQKRINEKKSWKRWHKRCQSIGYLLFDENETDDTDINEAIQMGIENYINQF